MKRLMIFIILTCLFLISTKIYGQPAGSKGVSGTRGSMYIATARAGTLYVDVIAPYDSAGVIITAAGADTVLFKVSQLEVGDTLFLGIYGFDNLGKFYRSSVSNLRYTVNNNAGGDTFVVFTMDNFRAEDTLYIGLSGSYVNNPGKFYRSSMGSIRYAVTNNSGGDTASSFHAEKLQALKDTLIFGDSDVASENQYLYVSDDADTTLYFAHGTRVFNLVTPLSADMSQDSLRLYFPFDGNANDYTAYGGYNNGAVTGATFKSQFDSFKIGIGAIGFVGIEGIDTNYVQLSAMTPCTSFSITTWIRSLVDDLGKTIFLGDEGNINAMWLRIDGDNKIGINLGSAGNLIRTSTRYYASDGWMHIGITYNYVSGVDSTLSIYVNGKHITSSSSVFPSQNASEWAVPFMGDFQYEGGQGSVKIIDEFKFYSGKVLTADEMENEYLYSDILNLLISKADKGEDEIITGKWIFDSTLTVNDTLYIGSDDSEIKGKLFRTTSTRLTWQVSDDAGADTASVFSTDKFVADVVDINDTLIFDTPSFDYSNGILYRTTHGGLRWKVRNNSGGDTSSSLQVDMVVLRRDTLQIGTNETKFLYVDSNDVDTALVFKHGTTSYNLLDPSADDMSQDSLQLYFPFDGNAYDYASYGSFANLGYTSHNNGIVVGAEFTSQPDSFKHGTGAIQFDAEGEYVDLYPGSMSPCTTYSISVWVNAWAKPNDLYIFMGDRGESFGLNFSIESDDDQLKMRQANTVYGAGTDVTISNNQWYHLGVTFSYQSGVDSTLKFYVNGKIIKSQQAKPPDQGAAYWTSPSIGAFSNSGSLRWRGQIDEFKFYSGRVLTDTEMRNEYLHSDVLNALITKVDKDKNTKDVYLYFHKDAVFDSTVVVHEGIRQEKIELNITQHRWKSITNDTSINCIQVESPDSAASQYYGAVFEWIIPDDFLDFPDHTTDSVFTIEMRRGTNLFQSIIFNNKSMGSDSLSYGGEGYSNINTWEWEVNGSTDGTQKMNNLNWVAGDKLIFQALIGGTNSLTDYYSWVRIRYNKK